MSGVAGDSLGDRMKDYERVARSVLPRKSWVILRVDGRNFHSWTRGLARPFDQSLASAIDATAIALCEDVAGAVFAYTQSDEISVLMHDLTKPGTEPWFGGVVQKMASISASIATAVFNTQPIMRRKPAQFDARVFSVPSASEAANYFIWRQHDAVRNSISMAAHSVFSQRELHSVNSNGMQEMMFSKGVNWNDYPARFKRGGIVVKHSGQQSIQYIDKRDQTKREVDADRSWWEIQSAPHFKHGDLLDMAERATGGHTHASI